MFSEHHEPTGLAIQPVYQVPPLVLPHRVQGQVETEHAVYAFDFFQATAALARNAVLFVDDEHVLVLEDAHALEASSAFLAFFLVYGHFRALFKGLLSGDAFVVD